MNSNHKDICFFIGGDWLQAHMLVPILGA